MTAAPRHVKSKPADLPVIDKTSFNILEHSVIIRDLVGAPAMQRRDHIKAMVKLFEGVARHRSRHEIFSDFTELTFYDMIRNCERSPRPHHVEARMRIMQRYDVGDLESMAMVFLHLTEALQLGPYDVLGELFMDLEHGNKHMGQFFTPYHVSQLMAGMAMTNVAEVIREHGFVKMSEPTCGAGGMVMAAAEAVINAGFNPLHHMHVVAQDISAIAARMCYIQMTLWCIPGIVIVGDTLRMEERETWPTIGHLIGNWDLRLMMRQMREHGAIADPAVSDGGKAEG